MKLLFFTFAPLSSKAGHLSRLRSMLGELSKLHEVTILNLGSKDENEDMLGKHRDVHFVHRPIKLNGWEVVDLDQEVEAIDGIVSEVAPDTVVMMMEVWDLMRELGTRFKAKIPFATVIHAMPFLVSPVAPTKDFDADVKAYMNSGIEDYRIKYISRHFKEAHEVFADIAVVANNKTVGFYLNNYFPELHIYQMEADFADIRPDTDSSQSLKYDFLYMARMEAGKGIEYLDGILREVSSSLKRKVTIAIAGRADDSRAKSALEALLSEKEAYEATFYGWLDEKGKSEILPYCGAFLYPSHYDNNPVVIGEALSYGLPTAVWDTIAMKLNYEGTEFVKRVELGDIKGFAIAAISLLEQRAELSEEARRFIKARPSLHELVIQDTEMFNQIVKGFYAKVRS